MSAIAAASGRSTTVPAAVLRQAEATPDQPAVIDLAGTLSYRDLVDRATALAAGLQAGLDAPLSSHTRAFVDEQERTGRPPDDRGRRTGRPRHRTDAARRAPHLSTATRSMGGSVTTYEPVGEPGTAVRNVVAAVWRDMLHVERAGDDDNFFQMGGDSLTAARLAAALRTALDVQVPMSAVFEHPTVAELAAALRARARARRGRGGRAVPHRPRLLRRGRRVDPRAAGVTELLTPEKAALLAALRARRKASAPDPDRIPSRGPADGAVASYAQRQMWYLSQLAPDAAYNIVAPRCGCGGRWTCRHEARDGRGGGPAASLRTALACGRLTPVAGGQRTT